MAGNSSENPPRSEILTDPNQFLELAYNTAVARYSGAENARIIVDISGISAPYWDSVTPHPQGSSVPLPAEIHRAVVVERGGFLTGFVLSDRHRSRYYRNPELSFQFGILNGKRERDWTDPRQLNSFFFNGMGVYHAGEIYFDQELSKLYTDAWADEITFGGKGFARLGREEQLTEKGLDMVAELVHRTFTNSTTMDDAKWPSGVL